MTENTIVMLLARAPRPSPPDYLFARLQADIRLPRPPVGNPNTEPGSWWSMFRWKSATAFGLFLLSCVLVVAVQATRVSELKERNAALRTATANLPELRQQSAEVASMRARVDDLDQLRKDNEDLQRLRSELEPMRQWPKEIQRLRNENERLSNALLTTGTATPEERFFAEARQDLEERGCIENLKQIGLAMRVWALDNEGHMPVSVVEMSNEVAKVTCLICPGDKAKQAFDQVSWSEFRPEMSSYQFYLTGQKDYGAQQPADPKYADAIVAKCPLHHAYLVEDGSVQKINPARFKELKINDRWYLRPIDASNRSQP